MFALRRFALAGAACVAAAAASADYYVRKDTWQDTMLASREALMKAKPGQEPAPLAGGLALGPWRVIGPFVAPRGKLVFKTPFPPEEKVDLAAAYEGGKLKWARRENWRDGQVVRLRAPSQACTYLYRTIQSPKPRKLQVFFGSDDGMVAWLNGQVVLSRDVPRGVAPNQDRAKLKLRRGVNHLLLKICNRTGGHGFYFSTKAKPADAKRLALEGLWRRLQRDFPGEQERRQMLWERGDRIWDADWPAGQAAPLAKRYVAAIADPKLRGEAGRGAQRVASAKDLRRVRETYYQAKAKAEAEAVFAQLNFDALERAIADLRHSFGDDYPQGAAFAAQLASLRSRRQADGALAHAQEIVDRFNGLQRQALLANPLLDFDRILVVKRSARAPKLGLPQNWQGNCALPRNRYDDEIATLPFKERHAKLATLYKPGKKFVGDVDLHFDGERLLFSSLDKDNHWQVFEIKTDGTGLRQITHSPHPKVDNYDPCYLPDGRIIFASTAPMLGVPCVGGKNAVANFYICDADGSNVRQLCFEQDHDWCPTVMPDGTVLYTRWEYTDTSHYFTRLLMNMNPDGTNQREFYGSNSFWPNSLFYARPCPGAPTKVVAIVSGHHGEARQGELVLLDVARGRHEADGAVQRIPGYGQRVEPKIADRLVRNSWPKFLHPYPLNDKYFLVAAKPHSRANWGVYLVDVFDNMLLLREEPGYALLEPTPLRPTKRPPVMPDRARPQKQEGVVYMADVYEGGGLAGIPRGTVKRLRLFEWHYAYQRIGGHNSVTVEGGWEPKRILGTVPVQPDGSAMFRVPANTPIAVQPLDAEGKALQLMRSWMVAMPGERLSCVGCHEPQNTAPIRRRTLASVRAAASIEPWRGPARGFSFVREVQPVLNQYCTGCHNGQPQQDGKTMPNFADTGRGRGGFTKSYLALHPYVRRPGPESDYHMFRPCEYHADTSELVQMLQKGHHGVQLDPEAWDRLVTWIDFNTPDFGTWTEKYGDKRVAEQCELRRQFRKEFAHIEENPEEICEPILALAKPTPAERAAKPKPPAPACPGWPFSSTEAKRRQAGLGQTRLSVDLGGGVKLDMVRIPAGEFVMGSRDGADDEAPLTRVRIERPFWMATCEIANEQFRLFDPAHDSRYIDQQWKDHTTPGYPANKPRQPVIRISWRQAMAFCQWLSERTGRAFSLPTEAQWEYACRAGSAQPFWYGGMDADFSHSANLADASIKLLAVKGVNPRPIKRPSILVDFVPRDSRFNDRAPIVAEVGSYAANPWGLRDMHGNVAEWTRTSFRPYPYADDGRDDPAAAGKKVVRGGSWRDRPYRATASYRLAYDRHWPVFNVGFRVVCR